MPTTEHRFELGDTIYIIDTKKKKDLCKTCEGIGKLYSKTWKSTLCYKCSGDGHSTTSLPIVVKTTIIGIEIIKTNHTKKEMYSTKERPLYPWEEVYITRKEAQKEAQERLKKIEKHFRTKSDADL